MTVKKNLFYKVRDVHFEIKAAEIKYVSKALGRSGLCCVFFLRDHHVRCGEASGSSGCTYPQPSPSSQRQLGVPRGNRTFCLDALPPTVHSGGFTIETFITRYGRAPSPPGDDSRWPPNIFHAHAILAAMAAHREQ